MSASGPPEGHDGEGHTGEGHDDARVTRRRAIIAVVTVVAMAAAGLAAGWSTAGRPLGQQVAPLCSAWADRVEAVALPGALDDPDQLTGMARAVAEVYADAGAELEPIRVDGASRGDLERLTGQVERRRELWQRLADDPRLDVELEVARELSGTWDGSFTALGAPGCDRVARPGGDEPVLDADRMDWAQRAVTACGRVLPQLADADGRAAVGELDTAGYLAAVGDALAGMDEVLGELPGGERSWTSLQQDRWARAVLGLSRAAKDGDLVTARERAREWSSLDDLSVPLDCQTAGAVSPQVRSALLFTATLDGVPAAGVGDGRVDDAEAVARNLGELLSSSAYGGVDPAFFVPAVLAGYPLSGGVVAGDVEPGVDQVSVRADGAQTTLAVRDTQGRCAGVLVTGSPRPDRFELAPGACTADQVG